MRDTRKRTFWVRSCTKEQGTPSGAKEKTRGTRNQEAKERSKGETSKTKGLTREMKKRPKEKAEIKRGSTKPKGTKRGETKDEGRDTRKGETPNQGRKRPSNSWRKGKNGKGQ